MRLSAVMKPLSLFFFWMPVSYMLYCLYPQNCNIFAVLGVSAAVFICSYIFKKHDTRAIRVLLCIFLISALGFAEFGFEIMPVPVFVFWAAFLIANLIEAAKEQHFMECSNELYSVIFLIVYAAAYSYEKVNMYAAFMLFAVFTVLKYIQNVCIKNEKQLGIISNYSVVDESGMLESSATSSLKTGFIMLAVCIFIGLLGKISIFNGINGSVRKAVKAVVNYVQGNKSVTDYEEPETGTEELGPEELYMDDTPVHPFWTVLGIAGTVLAFVYLIFLIIDKIITVRKNRITMPDFGTEIKVVPSEEKEEKKEKPEKSADYSHRKAIRRIYRSKIKKGRGKRNDDLYTKTPKEQRDKKISEGYDISGDFVKLYERARYSDDMLTKKDVKDMQEAGK